MIVNIHAVLQAPLVLVIMMSGFILLYRAHEIISGVVPDRTPTLQIALGLMFLALGCKQLFWHVVWALHASASTSDAVQLLSAPWVATGLNLMAIVFGGAAVILAGRPLFGAASPFIVIGCVIGVTLASAAMVA